MKRLADLIGAQLRVHLVVHRHERPAAPQRTVSATTRVPVDATFRLPPAACAAHIPADSTLTRRVENEFPLSGAIPSERARRWDCGKMHAHGGASQHKGGFYGRIPSFALVLVRFRSPGSRGPPGWRGRGWGRYPQNTASFAGTFSVQSRVKLPAGSLEISPPILPFLSRTVSHVS